MFSLKRAALAVTTVTAGVLLAASPAAAKGAPFLAIGLGTYSAVDNGLAYQGHLSGDPFDGEGTGAVTPMDATLPAVGVCEPAQATLRLDDGAGKYVELLSSGEVCGLYLPLGVMQQFKGRWSVTSTSVRKLTRAEGFLDVRLMNGQSDIYATS
jgi:hypothetical protein